MASEIWKPIPESPGYEASSRGRLKSKRFGRQRLLKLVLNSAGYFVVNLPLRAGSSSRLQLVHHLVAEAFLGPRPEGMVVMHLDDNKTNNRPSNLKYGTQGENIRAAVSTGRKSRSSKYHGVIRCRANKRWVARVTLNGRTKHVGSFADEDEAALAVNKFIVTRRLDIPLNEVSKLNVLPRTKSHSP